MTHNRLLGFIINNLHHKSGFSHKSFPLLTIHMAMETSVHVRIYVTTHASVQCAWVLAPLRKVGGNFRCTWMGIPVVKRRLRRHLSRNRRIDVQNSHHAIRYQRHTRKRYIIKWRFMVGGGWRSSRNDIELLMLRRNDAQLRWRTVAVTHGGSGSGSGSRSGSHSDAHCSDAQWQWRHNCSEAQLQWRAIAVTCIYTNAVTNRCMDAQMHITANVIGSSGLFYQGYLCSFLSIGHQRARSYRTSENLCLFAHLSVHPSICIRIYFFMTVFSLALDGA